MASQGAKKADGDDTSKAVKTQATTRRIDKLSHALAGGGLSSLGRVMEVAIEARAIAADVETTTQTGALAGLQADITSHGHNVIRTQMARSSGMPTIDDFIGIWRKTFAPDSGSDAGLAGCRVDLTKIGLAVAPFFYAFPTWRPMLGPLEVPPRERKARASTAAAAAAAGGEAGSGAGAAAGGKAAAPPRPPKNVDDLLDAETRAAARDARVITAGEASEAAQEARNAQRAQEIHMVLAANAFGDINLKATLRGYVETYADAATGETRPTTRKTRVVLDLVDEHGVEQTGIRAMNFEDALFDPWSYSQTVENVFYFSFLVKSGHAGTILGRSKAEAAAKPATPMRMYVFVRRPTDTKSVASLLTKSDAASGGSGSRPRSGGASDGALSFQATQWVFSIDPFSYKEALRLEGIEDDQPPVMPHRKTKDSTAPEGYAFYDAVASVVASGAAKAAAPAAAAAAGGATGGSKRSARPPPGESDEADTSHASSGPAGKRQKV